MNEPRSRRSFLTDLLTRAAGAFVLLAGGTWLTTGCDPTAKYGGPPEEEEPVAKYGGPPEDAGYPEDGGETAEDAGS